MIKNLLAIIVVILLSNIGYTQSEWISYNPIQYQQIQQPVPITNISYQQINNYPSYGYWIPYVIYQPVIYQSHHFFRKQNIVYYPTVTWVYHNPAFYKW